MPLQFNPFTGTFDVTTKGDTGTVAAAGDGTAAAPGITFASDTNTGIYRPGADQLALSTNGTGTLYIDASGRIGNGVSSPASLSTVYRSTINGDGSTIVGGLSLRNNGTETLTIGNITAANNTDIEIWNPRNGYLRFAANNAERLRITSTGQLSHIGAGSSGSPAVSFSGSAGSNSLVVDSSSRVGVGTSSPSKRFTILQDGADSALRIEQSGEGYNFYRNQANGFLYLEGPQQTFSGFGFRVTPTGGSTTNAVWIDNSGRVGIGTTSPSESLHVVGSIRASGAIFSTDGTRYALLGTDGSNPYLGTAGLAHSFVFKVGNGSSDVERARIDTSGRLLVGTTTSTTGSAFSKAEFVNNATYTDVVVGRGDGATGADATIGVISFASNAGSTWQPHASISASMDAASGNNDKPGRLVFSTTSDGQASPTPRLTITSTGQVRLAGAGITFNGDTATANELDDYEEGTWTPTATPSTSGTITLSSVTASYTKIGNTVSIRMFALVSAVSSPLGYIDISLPFTNSGSAAGSVLFYNGDTGAVMSNFIGRVSGNVFRITYGTGQVGTGSASYARANSEIDIAAVYRN